MGRFLQISQALDVDELPIFVVVQVASFVVSRFTSMDQKFHRRIQ
jgi:hypothetical protein